MRHPVLPRSCHYEVQDTAGKLVGDCRFSLPHPAAEIATGLQRELPDLGELRIVEVEEVLVVERHTRIVASIVPKRAA